MAKAHRHKGQKNVKAVLFDFDGTITVPGLIDFLAVKKAIQCPEHSTILEFIAGLPTREKRQKALRVMEAHEQQAANSAQSNENA